MTNKRIRKWSYWSLAAVLGGFFLLNFAAYNHAKAMTSFVDSGERTRVPESLSWLEKIKVLFNGVNIPRPVNLRNPSQIGFSFTNEVIHSSNEPDLELWIIEAPNPGGVALLFPGYSGCKDQLLDLVPSFNEFDFHTVLVDFRGSGGSGGNKTSLGHYESIDVTRVREWANERYPSLPVVIYGFSMGGAAALKSISKDSVIPKPAGIIVECTYGKLLSTVRKRFQIMGLPSFPAAELLLFWGGVQQDFNPFELNPVDFADEISVPALVLQGGLDERVAGNDARELVEAFKGKSRMVIFSNIGHQISAKANPESWRAAVSQFFGELHIGTPDRSP